MRKHNRSFLPAALLLVVLFTGCAQVPQEKLDEAQAALLRADEAEADLYVAEQFRAAQDSFAAAQVEIEVQSGKSAFSRDYSDAEALLQSTIDAAQAAIEGVEVGKEAVRLEAEGLLAEAQAAVTRAQELLAQAKPGDVALVSFQEDAGTVQSMLAEAATAQQNGEFARARDLAKAALDKANALIAAVSQPAGATHS